jgi:hypothetical protein
MAPSIFRAAFQFAKRFRISLSYWRCWTCRSAIVVPSGAELYVLVPRMCPYCVRGHKLVSRSGLNGEESFTARSFQDRADDRFHAMEASKS